MTDSRLVRATYERALTFLRAGDGVMAEQLCRDALAENPGEPNLSSLLGAALNRQGRGSEAEPLLRRALRDLPQYAKGHEELGRALQQMGRAKEAIGLLRQAVALDPKLQSAQLALVQALAEAGWKADADEALQAFLRADPAREQFAKAAECHRAGKREEAEGIYRQILQRDPKHVEALRFLALIAFESEHYGQAEQLLKRAVDIAPDYLAGWIDLSRTQLERLDLPAAAASIERAALLSPRSAIVQVHVAHVQARSGRHGEAIAAYRSATARRPSASEAWWSLSNLKTFRFEDAEIAEMERQLAREEIGGEQRVQFSFALAKAFEDRGEHARAFEHYAAGNRLRRAREHYDPVQTEVMHERIRGVFDGEFLARHAGSGNPDPAPVFVVGLPRSGSTLIEQVLSSHSAVDATHELPEVGRLIQQIGRDRTDRVAYPEAVRDYDAASWAALGRSYLDHTRQYRGAAPRFIDKNPNNFPSIGLLALALPNARFVNARRHPLDACLSCYRQLFARGQPFTYDLTELGEYYLEYEKMMAHWHAVRSEEHTSEL